MSFVTFNPLICANFVWRVFSKRAVRRASLLYNHPNSQHTIGSTSFSFDIAQYLDRFISCCLADSESYKKEWHIYWHFGIKYSDITSSNLSLCLTATWLTSSPKLALVGNNTTITSHCYFVRIYWDVIEATIIESV